MVPEEPGIGALGVFFWQGNFGDLHLPRELPTPKRYQSVDTAGLVAAVRRDYGFTLTSPVIDPASWLTPLFIAARRTQGFLALSWSFP